MNGARIVAYTYASADAEAFGPSPPFASTSTIGSIEQGTPGTTTLVRPTAPVSFYAPEAATDQVRVWQQMLNAHTPAGMYSVTYDPATKRVTVASTNSTPFRLVLPERTALWSGITQALGASYATSWTGESAPAAVAELLGATVEPAEEASRIELHEYRQGRAVAVTWNNHNVHRVRLYLSSSNLHVFEPGYLVTGRVRIYQGGSTDPYSAANPGGFVDGWVVASTDPTEDGDIGELWAVDLAVAVTP